MLRVDKSHLLQPAHQQIHTDSSMRQTHTVDLPLAPAPSNSSLTSFRIFFSSYIKHQKTFPMPHQTLTSLRDLSISRLRCSAGPSDSLDIHPPILPLAVSYRRKTSEGVDDDAFGGVRDKEMTSMMVGAGKVVVEPEDWNGK